MRFARFIAAVFLLALPTGALSAVCSPYAFKWGYTATGGGARSIGWHLGGGPWTQIQYLNNPESDNTDPRRFRLYTRMYGADLSGCGVEGAEAFQLKVDKDLKTGEQTTTIELFSGYSPDPEIAFQSLAIYTGHLFLPNPPSYRLSHYPEFGISGYGLDLDNILGFSRFTNLETGDILFPKGFRLIGCHFDEPGSAEEILGIGSVVCNAEQFSDIERDWFPLAMDPWPEGMIQGSVVYMSAPIIPTPLPGSVALSLSGLGLLSLIGFRKRRMQAS